MEILHICPANLATGGTEGIHNLVNALCSVGADAKILYVGNDLASPQPKEYEKYHCKYITEFPKDFTGVVIFPEVYANKIIDAEYVNCTVAVNWQGVDVYNWNTPERERGAFLQRMDAIHIANSEYAVEHLQKLGLNPVKISDCIADEYFGDFSEQFQRNDYVLYNPTAVKLTRFQKILMSRATTEFGIKFQPLSGYTQAELIDLFRHRKLYIDFGVFSGRERLPREAVMCGCCIITSKMGTAGYYKDNGISEKYKFDNVDSAISMIQYVLKHYDECKLDFDEYRNALLNDKKAYKSEVEALYNAILNHNSGV